MHVSTLAGSLGTSGKEGWANGKRSEANHVKRVSRTLPLLLWRCINLQV